METTNKKLKSLWIVTIVLVCLNIVSEFFAGLWGFESLRMMLGNYENNETLGLIVSVPFFLITFAIVAFLSLLSIIFTSILLKNNHYKKSSILILILSILFIIVDIAILILIILNGSN